MSIENAKVNLANLISDYSTLTEKEKFELGSIFRIATGGKLSPYNSPQPVAVALIPVVTEDNELKLVAIRRGIQPKIGELALPGGFFDSGEHGQQAVAREVREETGLELDESKFLSHHYPMTSPTNNTLIFFRYSVPQEISQAELNTSFANAPEVAREASEIVLIDQNTPLAFPYHEQAVKSFYAEFGHGFKNNTPVKPR